MHKSTKFYLFLLLGVCVFMPFIYMSILTQIYAGMALFSLVLLFYSYLVYTGIYLRRKRKYPLAPPEGKADIYFPRTDIPRPIYEDVQRHPRTFKKKKPKKDQNSG